VQYTKHETQADCRIPIIEFGECLFVARGDAAHQFFVGGFHLFKLRLQRFVSNTDPASDARWTARQSV